LSKDYMVTVWINKPNSKHPRARTLSTVTNATSQVPLARPLSILLSDPAYSDCLLANSDEEARNILDSATVEQTIVLPLAVAKSVLGWAHYEFTQK